MIARRIIGTLAGFGFSTATILSVEKLGHLALGAPASPAEATTAMYLVVLVGWVLGAAVGGSIGSGISRWAGTAWIIAVLVALGVVASAFSFPDPWWLVAAGVVLPLLAAYLVTRSRPAEIPATP
ncbi:hypothetical protein GCM10022280_20910 [Sphingomonas swuensis]|uniref:Major facilitator superfamily (MFS) profile domain-containing protein n=1 Tax=Sphingomonas swuensis TaxID=977800 RepID=A0ABP7T3C1_9SPHN